MKVAKCGDVIGVEDWSKYGMFDAATGVRISGTLELKPDDVLYYAWRQTQSPRIQEVVLRAKWLKMKKE